jgi:hypothetical protein
MSSLTKVEFREELKLKGYISSFVTTYGDSVLDNFIDKALRAFSDKLPQVMISEDNTVVNSELTFPTNALAVTRLRSSSSGKDADFNVDNVVGIRTIKVGNIHGSSTDDLITSEYYEDPLNVSTKELTTTDVVDIEYVLLQTIPTISDSSLEAIEDHIDYQIYDVLAGNALEEAMTSNGDNPTTITDTASNGSTTQITYDPKTSAAKRYIELSKIKLDRFKEQTEIGYMVRG